MYCKSALVKQFHGTSVCSICLHLVTFDYLGSALVSTSSSVLSALLEVNAVTADDVNPLWLELDAGHVLTCRCKFKN